MKRLLAFAVVVGAFAGSRPARAQQPHAPPVVASSASPHGPDLKQACSTCHGPAGWKPVRIARDYKHAERTFPLAGAHASATCSSCHKTLDFARTPASCATCHQDVHRGELGTDCARCHTSRAFVDRSAMTRMHQLTRFPLRGAHAVMACESCHAPVRGGQLQFVRANATCAGCHAATFRAAVAPPHVEPAFSMDCTACHTSASWSGAKFDHSRTLFPLTGGHLTASCADCHADKQYHGRSMECASCHRGDYDKTVDPPHAQGFPTACASCHTTARWTGARFDHAQVTRFPLTGSHRTVACSGCHGDNVFTGKSQECVACHRPAYDRTTTPKHAAAGFSTSCALCHNTTQWPGAVYDHAATQFPLTGAHRTATCQSCHGDGVYDGKPTTCVSCHLAKYNATTNPGHKTAGFSTACETCHNTTQWPGAVFDHNSSQFPLTGAHRAATCADCHADGVYDGKPTTCVSCHLTTYNGTTNPNHKTAGFSTACETCHTTTQWPGAVFDHTNTLFPLTGAHRAATCQDCHADGVYKGKPTTCVTCHSGNYSASTNPHHAAAGFLTTCETCHNTTQWAGAPYNHSATAFPLTGAHVGQPCISCHASKVYDGLPSACAACHLTDYNATTNPKHSTAMFPTTCDACHTTTQWLGATFNHDGPWFPIYSGTHAGKWTQCSECHVNAANYQVFTCLLCHPHSDQAKTDGAHVGKVSGYSYDSIKCYACHPRGTH